MLTSVVNIKKHQYDVYIGRRNTHYELPRSRWANPFVVGNDGPLPVVLAKYHAYLAGRADLISALPQLRGKRLGCWCKKDHSDPTPCHGDILIRALYEFHGDDIHWIVTPRTPSMTYALTGEYGKYNIWVLESKGGVEYRVLIENTTIRFGVEDSIESAKEAVRRMIRIEENMKNG